MKPLELIIQTEPHAKARARTSWRNGIVHSYTPDSTQEAESFIKDFIRPYNQYRFPEHTALKVTLLFYRTKSRWRTMRREMGQRRQFGGSAKPVSLLEPVINSAPVNLMESGRLSRGGWNSKENRKCISFHISRTVLFMRVLSIRATRIAPQS